MNHHYITFNHLKNIMYSVTTFQTHLSF